VRIPTIHAWVLMAPASLPGLPVIAAAQEAPPQNPPAASQSDPVPNRSAEPQVSPPQTNPVSNGAVNKMPYGQMRDARQPTEGERRKAAKLYLSAAKLYQQGKFEDALRDNQQAAALDPSNENYRMAVEVSRAHAASALVQAAAKARIQGDVLGARAAISRAFQLDPRNPQVTQHLNELGENPLPDDLSARNEQAASSLGEMIRLEPASGVHSFHFHTNQRQVI